MQFKIDENLPIEIAELLNDAGYDAKTVNNQQLQGVKDHPLVNVCKSEHRARRGKCQTFIIQNKITNLFQSFQ